jgi:hypothetical protein
MAGLSLENDDAALGAITELATIANNHLIEERLRQQAEAAQ